jgi:ribosomal protein S18 acetylase RimI-like enzyme
MSDVTLAVRRAVDADLGAVGALVGGVYLGEGWSPESARARLADGEWIARQGTLLVAERDGAVVGAVVLALPGDPGRQVGGDDEAEFRLLAVSTLARGAGAGEALVRAVIEHARARGFAAVVLSTQAGMIAAQRIYARLGFERQPARDWSRPSATMLVYRLDLGPAESRPT